MSTELETRNAARERLFDALLTDAVEAEATRTAHRGSNARWWLLAAGLLLGLIVTIGVAVLRPIAEPPVAQDPHAFDPIFPTLETVFRYSQRTVWLPGRTSVEQLRSMPRSSLPPITVHQPLGPPLAEAVFADIVLDVIAIPGVHKLTIGGTADDQRTLDADHWAQIGAMADLETLVITVQADGVDLRRLRLAPRLHNLCLTSPLAPFDVDRAQALAELPHLACLRLWNQTVSTAARCADASTRPRAPAGWRRGPKALICAP